MKKVSLITPMILLSSLSCFAEPPNLKSAPAPHRHPSIFAQGDEGLPMQSQAAYNYPARIQIADENDVSLHASFIYWYAFQQNMILADSNTPSGPVIARQTANWKPGFQVGASWNTPHDDWTLGANYIWLYGSTTKSFHAPSDGGNWNIYKWIVGTTYPTTNTYLRSNWRLHFNLLDVFLTRPYYEGRYLTVSPLMGLRGVWIDQQLHLASNQASSALVWKNWMIGPNVGVFTKWLLGMGIRVQADVEGSLLYSRFTKVFGSSIPRTGLHYQSREHDLYYASPVFKMGLGMGWGGYCCNNQSHFDLSASYDLIHLLDQNVMQQFLTATYGDVGPYGSLTLQGLTISARVDF